MFFEIDTHFFNVNDENNIIIITIIVIYAQE